MTRPIAALLLCASTLIFVGAQTPPAPAALIVFAASDLGPALNQITPKFEKESKSKVTVVLGSTGTLMQQIRNGAPADVFMAANDSSVDELAGESLIVPESRTTYARGRLALVTAKSTGLRLRSLKELTLMRIKRVAIANPAHAPYGLAAQQALENTGLWASMKPKLVFGENVQQAAQFVVSGAAEAGIVARSVAGQSALVWELVDEKLHAPLNQTAAVLARSPSKTLARSFLDFVNGPSSKTLSQFGFQLPGQSF